MNHPVISPKKLIEVALPLDAINVACAREKSIRHGHPGTLHLWWARRPLAAARGVVFAQLVNDPSWKWELENPGRIPPGHLKATWAKSRKRLFTILEDLVVWENTTNLTVLESAREEIRKSWKETCLINRSHPDADKLFDPKQIPSLHDPFCGGGAIPLEAQRLGLTSFASDLNPIAVCINKAMIDIPQRFQGSSPVNPQSRQNSGLIAKEWTHSNGLAEDVEYYGTMLRERSRRLIGHLYLDAEVTKDMVSAAPHLKPYLGEHFTPIAYIWARTVKSPNPAFSHVQVPLASTFVLSSKRGTKCYVEPIIAGDKYTFVVREGVASDEIASGTKVSRGANFRCLLSNVPIEPSHIKAEGMAGRLGTRLMAIVVEGPKGRLYLPPNAEHERIASSAEPDWTPETPLPNDVRNFWTLNYGLSRFGDLFTKRQLVALTTLSKLVSDVRGQVLLDAVSFGMLDDKIRLAAGGNGATAYADGIAVYLAFLIDQQSNQSSMVCGWNNINQQMIVTFSRQSLPMTWDFAECNVFSSSSGSFNNLLERQVKGIRSLGWGASVGTAVQADAATQSISDGKIISTDPPYYNNICYADLSDYFYVWLRPTLRDVFPDLFSTLTVPKAEELVATPYRHGGTQQAESFFMTGMGNAMGRLAQLSHKAFPITIYYAFKQSDTKKGGTASTGWETFLDAVSKSGLSVVGTWPIKTESANKLKANVNALASSIVLVCRPRLPHAKVISRRDFIRELNQVLPESLDEMTRGVGGELSPVAPVDLSQAVIGPGMAVFTKYAAVLEADGQPMSIKSALQLINRFLAEDDFDADTQFCLHWFEQYGWETGKFGEADVLARSKGTSVDGVKQAGVLHAAGGNVRLLKWAEYPSDWDPQSDQRLPTWEVLHQLIRVFNTDGETGAAAVFAAAQSKVEAARQLAYRLYTLCERKNWAEDARAYNEVVTSWSGIESAAAKEPTATQRTLFE